MTPRLIEFLPRFWSYRSWSSKFRTCVMFYSGKGKSVAPYNSSLVENQIFKVFHVKSKNEYNLDIDLVRSNIPVFGASIFLSLMSSDVWIWDHTAVHSSLWAIQAWAIPFYGLSSIFPHTQRSLLCLRLECSSARGAQCHGDSCDFDSNTFTSYFTSSVNQYCTVLVQLSFCATMTLGVQLPFMGSMGVVKAGVIEWGQQDDFEKE